MLHRNILYSFRWNLVNLVWNQSHLSAYDHICLSYVFCIVFINVRDVVSISMLMLNVVMMAVTLLIKFINVCGWELNLSRHIFQLHICTHLDWYKRWVYLLLLLFFLVNFLYSNQLLQDIHVYCFANILKCWSCVTSGQFSVIYWFTLNIRNLKVLKWWHVYLFV